MSPVLQPGVSEGKNWAWIQFRGAMTDDPPSAIHQLQRNSCNPELHKVYSAGWKVVDPKKGCWAVEGMVEIVN